MKVTSRQIFRFSSWDFATILKTSGFLDKTLLIKNVFEKEVLLLVLAPRLSGKSTILNMMKKFLEATVDLDGNQNCAEKSPNYEIFVKNNLNIFKHDSLFFHQHFGLYPVLYIDFKPLSVISNYVSMLKQFREIILNTFEPYEFLIEQSRVWKSEASKSRFMKYCHGFWNISLSETEIRTSFTFLSKLLFIYFNKKVIVLMDEFDSFVDSPFLKDGLDRSKIIDFIYTVNYRLLKCNSYFSRAFITGPMRQENIRLKAPLNEVLPLSVVEYNCQNFNSFSEYYGVSQVELDFLLAKFYSKHHLREKVKNCIVMKSTEIEQKMKLYGLWSVLRYLANFNTTSECLQCTCS